MKTGSSDLAASAETEVFAYFRPTQKEKIVQKAERDSLTMHKNDPKESSNFGKVVEAGGNKVQVLELESMEARRKESGHNVAICSSSITYVHFASSCLNHFTKI